MPPALYVPQIHPPNSSGGRQSNFSCCASTWDPWGITYNPTMGKRKSLLQIDLGKIWEICYILPWRVIVLCFFVNTNCIWTHGCEKTTCFEVTVVVRGGYRVFFWKVPIGGNWCSNLLSRSEWQATISRIKSMNLETLQIKRFRSFGTLISAKVLFSPRFKPYALYWVVWTYLRFLIYLRVLAFYRDTKTCCPIFQRLAVQHSDERRIVTEHGSLGTTQVLLIQQRLVFLHLMVELGWSKCVE